MREGLIAIGFVATLFSGAVSAVPARSGVEPAALSAAGDQAPPAKTPAPPAQAQPPAPPPATPVEAPPDNYTYDPQGRRDPFVTPLGTGVAERAVSKRGAGPAGMATADISVRGVMESRGAFIALIKGADARTYVVRAGDRLLDGVVKSVGPDGLTVVQDVNDPLSLVKTREVRKPLRSKEDGKP